MLHLRSTRAFTQLAPLLLPFPVPTSSLAHLRITTRAAPRPLLFSPLRSIATTSRLAMQSEVNDTLPPAKASASATMPPPASSPVKEAPAAASKPPQFHPVAPSIYVSRPTDQGRAGVNPAALAPLRSLEAGLQTVPRDVVIFGWMDAPLRLVAKYAVPYTVLFPSANVYVKLSDGKSYLSSDKRRKRDLEPLVDFVRKDAEPKKASASAQAQAELGDSTVTLLDTSQTLGSSSNTPTNEGLLIHSFSDGGAGNLALFLSMLPQSASAPRIYSLIMDSSPGKSTPSSGANAFTMPLVHRPALRAVVRLLVFLGLYLLKVWTRLKGQPTRAEKMRGTLNALATWSWVTGSRASLAARSGGAEAKAVPPRMYLYSKADKLIPWRYVEEHAREFADRTQGTGAAAPRLVEMQSSQQDGKKAVMAPDTDTDTDTAEESGKMTVELRRWDTAPHCGIVRTDFEGYWDAVMQFHRAVLLAST